MVKVFGLRITPFFLFIFGLECLALLVSVYLGILLYQDTTTISVNLVDRSIYSALFLVILLSILTPGFFHQTKVVNHMKSINEKIYGIVGAIITMMIIVFTNTSQVDPKTLFIAALLSAFVGLIISQASVLNKYWRFMIRSGVN